jgi:hypothetical protein
VTNALCSHPTPGILRRGVRSNGPNPSCHDIFYAHGSPSSVAWPMTRPTMRDEAQNGPQPVG